MSGFKLTHQRRRAQALVGVIDAALLDQGVDVVDQAGRVVLILLGWTDKDWANAANVAELATPPSEETRELVRGHYRMRSHLPVARAGRLAS